MHIHCHMHMYRRNHWLTIPLVDDLLAINIINIFNGPIEIKIK